MHGVLFAQRVLVDAEGADDAAVRAGGRRVAVVADRVGDLVLRQLRRRADRDVDVIGDVAAVVRVRLAEAAQLAAQHAVGARVRRHVGARQVRVGVHDRGEGLLVALRCRAGAPRLRHYVDERADDEADAGDYGAGDAEGRAKEIEGAAAAHAHGVGPAGPGAAGPRRRAAWPAGLALGAAFQAGAAAQCGAPAPTPALA